MFLFPACADLLQTRITTKYNIPNLDSPKYAKKRARNEASKSRKDAKDPKSETAETEPAQPRSAKAYLELKTYDPESGVTLKYKTDKAAEVGRLIASLGRMGRYMAALPEIAEGKSQMVVEIWCPRC